jgi:hypothetical protein
MLEIRVPQPIMTDHPSIKCFEKSMACFALVTAQTKCGMFFLPRDLTCIHRDALVCKANSRIY